LFADIILWYLLYLLLFGLVSQKGIVVQRVLIKILVLLYFCFGGILSANLIFDMQHCENGYCNWVVGGHVGNSKPIYFAKLSGWHFPLKFGSGVIRNSWDFKLNLDMSKASGICFRFRCDNLSGVETFCFHFRSGSGWYNATFVPSATSDWQTIRIVKEMTSVDGAVLGWGDIRGFRFAAWSSLPGKCCVDLASFEVIPNSSRIAIVRNIAAGAGVFSYTKKIMRDLSGYGVIPAVLDDAEVAVDRLLDYGVVILPYNPKISSRQLACLRGYVKGGGKIIGFFGMDKGLEGCLGIHCGKFLSSRSLPAKLSGISFVDGVVVGSPKFVRQRSWNIYRLGTVEGRSVVYGNWADCDGKGVGEVAVVLSDVAAWVGHVYLADDSVHGGRWLLAMLGHFEPAIWRSSALKGIFKIVNGFSYKNTIVAYSSLKGKVVGNLMAKNCLNRMVFYYNKAINSFRAGKYIVSLDCSALARMKLCNCFCYLQKARVGEFRGVWVQSEDGLGGKNWDEGVKQLASYGINAIFPKVASLGHSCYPSKCFGAKSEKVGVDFLRLCERACIKHGVELHPWLVCLSLSLNDDKLAIEKFRREQRLQVAANGKVNCRWLCPSDVRNQDLQLKIVRELLQNYKISGIHLDYIRYPNNGYCFCAGCRKRFEKFLGKSVVNWPAAVMSEGRLHDKWGDFCRGNIDRLVCRIHKEVKAIRSSVKVSAAVLRNVQLARAKNYQDWGLWCKNRWLDFVCPMDYIVDNAGFAVVVDKQIKLLAEGKVKCYPGIGLTTSVMDSIGLIQQIKIIREKGCGGFVIFDYTEKTAKENIPDLAKGIIAH